MPYGRYWFNQGRGMGMGMGRGRGVGNSHPFCRNFPWLPRRWWATPYADQYTATCHYNMEYGYPNHSTGFMPSYGHPWDRMGLPR